MAYETKKSSTNYMNKLFLNQDCLLTTAIESVQGRWTIQVLVCIRIGKNRFGMIKDKLPGITDNVLGLRLNHLAKNKLITKHMLGTERTYSLTENGLGLVDVLEDLAKWQEKRQSSHPSLSKCAAVSKK